MVHQIRNIRNRIFNIHTINLVFLGRRSLYTKERYIVLTMLCLDLNTIFHEIGGEMKLKDILTLSQKKLSGLDIMLYYCLKELSTDNNMPSLTHEIKPYFKDYSFGGINKCLNKLEQVGLIITSLDERGKREKIYFNEIETPILERKKTTKPKCGIYKIYNNSNVYIGQSKNIKERWKNHKQKMIRGIHPYFSKQETDQVTYEILEECKISELSIKEILWSQRLKDKGLKVLNEENFTLIQEDE